MGPPARGQIPQSDATVVGKVISSDELFVASNGVAESVKEPGCTDPLEAGEDARRPSTKAEMAEAWAEGRRRAEKTQANYRVMEATEATVEGRKFSFRADVGEVLDKHGPGVYTVALTATLEGVGEKDRSYVISEHSIFHGVEVPEGYGGSGRFYGRNSLRAATSPEP